MNENATKTSNPQPTKPTARELILALTTRVPLGERGEPLIKELFRIFSSKPETTPQGFKLPDYCYNIFQKVRKTLFKALPTIDDTVFCPDPSKLANVKSYEEAKKYIRIDWYQFGKVIGILLRGARFCELEAESHIKKEGLWDLKSEDEQIVTGMLGANWLESKGVPLSTMFSGELPAKLTAIFSENNTPDRMLQHYWNEVAFEFGTDAVAEFNRGIADGIKGFMDQPGDFPGKTSRTNDYVFFLLIWPEIKDMLERNPLPDRTEVFEWMTPYHDAGLVCLPNIENFRDFCESIGLKFAGKIPKKS